MTNVLLLLFTASVVAAVNPCSDLTVNGNLAGPREYENCVVSSRTISVDQATLRNVSWTGGALQLLSSVDVNVTLIDCTMRNMASVLLRSSADAIRNVTLSVIRSSIVSSSHSLTLTGAFTTATAVSIAIVESAVRTSQAVASLQPSSSCAIVDVALFASFSEVHGADAVLGVKTSSGVLEADNVTIAAESCNVSLVSSSGMHRGALGLVGQGSSRLRNSQIVALNSTVMCSGTDSISCVSWMSHTSLSANDTNVNATMTNITVWARGTRSVALGWQSGTAISITRAKAVADRSNVAMNSTGSTVLCLAAQAQSTTGILEAHFLCKESNITLQSPAGDAVLALAWSMYPSGLLQVHNSTVVAHNSRVAVLARQWAVAMGAVSAGSNLRVIGVSMSAAASAISATAVDKIVVTSGLLTGLNYFEAVDVAIATRDSQMTALSLASQPPALSMGGSMARTSCSAMTGIARNVTISAENCVVVASEIAFDLASLCTLSANRYVGERPMSVVDWQVSVRGGSVTTHFEEPFGRCFRNLANFSSTTRPSSVRGVTLNCSRYASAVAVRGSLFASDLFSLNGLQPFRLNQTVTIAPSASPTRSQTHTQSRVASASTTASLPGTITPSFSKSWPDTRSSSLSPRRTSSRLLTLTTTRGPRSLSATRYPRQSSTTSVTKSSTTLFSFSATMVMATTDTIARKRISSTVSKAPGSRPHAASQTVTNDEASSTVVATEQQPRRRLSETMTELSSPSALLTQAQTVTLLPPSTTAPIPSSAGRDDSTGQNTTTADDESKLSGATTAGAAIGALGGVAVLTGGGIAALMWYRAAANRSRTNQNSIPHQDQCDGLEHDGDVPTPLSVHESCAVEVEDVTSWAPITSNLAPE